MGNLAAMLQKIGHTVSGSDKPLYPPMSDKLREWGIEVKEFDERNVKGVDLVIVGNAISRGNVEVEYVLNQRLPYMSMSRALAEFFLKERRVIVVAGTHGKTTTTFLIDHILSQSGEKPGLFAGGVRGDGMDGFRVPDKSPYFVIEGDEYDTAFFDKAAKFLHYRPRFVVLTSVEYDHADIYENEREYRRAFARLLRIVPSEGAVIACAADRGVREVLSGYELAPVQWYAGKNAGLMSARNARNFLGGFYSFRRQGRRVEFDFPGMVEDFALIGEHNTSNALAAALVGRYAGVPKNQIVRALRSFPGVLRRQQVRLDLERTKETDAPLSFIEDFAHHPTAVKATIAAVREAYPGRRVHALFEPRSATSHRSVFQRRYASSLAKAHSVYVCDVFDKNKVPAVDRLDVKKIVADINAGRKSKDAGAAFFGKNADDLFERFRKSFAPSAKGDVVLAMSNGAFGGIYPRMDEFLRSLAEKKAPKKSS